MRKLIYLLFISSLLQLSSSESFQYDVEMAKNLVGFSTLSYCKPENVPTNNCGEPCKRNPSSLIDYVVLSAEKTNTQGFVGYSSDHNSIVIAFRGTISTDITNWLTNLDMKKESFPECSAINCKVHSGFLDHYNNIKEQLISAFTKLKDKYPNAKILLTGHSLGGAIATLSLPLLYQLNKNKQIDVFYSFGCPRVGNIEFTQWFVSLNLAKQYGRITHGQDPVIHAPPSQFPFYFKHIPHEIYYKDFSSENSEYILCDKVDDPNCKRSNILYTDVFDHLTYFGWSLKDSKRPCK